MRRMMTFLEVLIAMGLTMVLLTSLTFFYRQVSDINSRAEKLEKLAFEQSYIEMRLARIFSQAIVPDNKNFFFYTGDNNHLILSFKNGIHFDKKMTNDVLGRLYLDKNHNLCLALWPSPDRWKEGDKESIEMKKEILLCDVESLSYEFYVPPERDRSRIAKIILNIEPKGAWHKEWSRDYKQLPAMIRIHIKRKSGELLTFAYPIPKSNLVVMYE